MGLFRVYVDGALFYHPHMSKLAITQAQIQVKVSVADKFRDVYAALFEKQFGRREYEITVGEACFSAETRESFFKLLSLLSEDANYSYQ